MNFREFQLQHDSIVQCINSYDALNHLYEIGEIKLIRTMVGTCNDIGINHIFATVCSKGNLKLAKFLYGNFIIDAHHHINLAFSNACHNNHIDVAQWLKTIRPDINHRRDDDYVIFVSTMNNFKVLLKWLTTFYTVDTVDIIIYYCLRDDRINIVKYIIKYFDIDELSLKAYRNINQTCLAEYQLQLDNLIQLCQQNKYRTKSATKI